MPAHSERDTGIRFGIGSQQRSSATVQRGAKEQPAGSRARLGGEPGIVTGRPVKWVPDRSESFVTDTQGRDNIATLELAFLAEVDPSYLGRVERGDNNVAILTLAKNRASARNIGGEARSEGATISRDPDGPGQMSAC